MNSNGSSARVTLTREFFIGKYEVTEKEWKAVMGTEPWQPKNSKQTREADNFPATAVSWFDANDFCQKISEIEGQKYRLPTEAEWEYACRAGTITNFCFGDDTAPLKEYAWFNENSVGVNKVGQKKENPWGLCDIYGNVWEWCSDWHGASSSYVDPQGSLYGTERVYRGGGYGNNNGVCTSSCGYQWKPEIRARNIGFRVIREAGK